MLVHNKGNYIRHVGTRLIPGVNSLDDSSATLFLEVVANNPLNKALVGKELFYDEKKETSAGITDMKAEEAIELINDTFDIDLLNTFQDEEEALDKPRKTVLKAIEARIESIVNPDEDSIVELDN